MNKQILGFLFLFTASLSAMEQGSIEVKPKRSYKLEEVLAHRNGKPNKKALQVLKATVIDEQLNITAEAISKQILNKMPVPLYTQPTAKQQQWAEKMNKLAKLERGTILTTVLFKLLDYNNEECPLCCKWDKIFSRKPNREEAKGGFKRHLLDRKLCLEKFLNGEGQQLCGQRNDESDDDIEIQNFLEKEKTPSPTKRKQSEQNLTEEQIAQEIEKLSNLRAKISRKLSNLENKQAEFDMDEDELNIAILSSLKKANMEQ